MSVVPVTHRVGKQQKVDRKSQVLDQAFADDLCERERRPAPKNGTLTPIRGHQLLVVVVAHRFDAIKANPLS